MERKQSDEEIKLVKDNYQWDVREIFNSAINGNTDEEKLGSTGVLIDIKAHLISKELYEVLEVLKGLEKEYGLELPVTESAIVH